MCYNFQLIPEKKYQKQTNSNFSIYYEGRNKYNDIISDRWIVSVIVFFCDSIEWPNSVALYSHSFWTTASLSHIRWRREKTIIMCFEFVRDWIFVKNLCCPNFLCFVSKTGNISSHQLCSVSAISEWTYHKRHFDIERWTMRRFHDKSEFHEFNNFNKAT